MWLYRAPLTGSGLLLEGLRAFNEPGAARALAAGAALVAGFLSNVSLFLPPRRWLSVAAMAAPWAPFLVLWVMYPAVPAWKQWYFYPWMAGITLIQGTRFAALAR